MLPYASAMLMASAAAAGGGSGGPYTTNGQLGMPWYGQNGGWGANPGRIIVTQFTARLDADSTFSSYSFHMGNGAVAGNKFKPVLYSDSAGLPGSLIATGTEITLTGSESNTTLTYSFGSTVTLTHGTKYWFGIFMNDGSWSWQQGTGESDFPNSRNKDGLTYSSGAPSTLTSTGDTGGISPIVVNATIARGVAGFWDALNNVGGDDVGSANDLYLIKVTIPGTGTASAQSIGIRLGGTVTVGGKLKGVIYADSSGVPGALFATGSEVTVAAAYDELSSTFTGVSLSGGTTYWIGGHSDSAQRYKAQPSVAGTSKVQTGATYASGPPATFTGIVNNTVTPGFYLKFA